MVHPNFWLTIILGSPEFRFSFDLLLFSVHLYFLFTIIFCSGVFFGSPEFWFLFGSVFSVHMNFWFTINFGSPKYYFRLIEILVSFLLFIIIIGSLLFLVHYYFRYTQIFGSLLFSVRRYFWFTIIFGSPKFYFFSVHY